MCIDIIAKDKTKDKRQKPSLNGCMSAKVFQNAAGIAAVIRNGLWTKKRAAETAL